MYETKRKRINIEGTEIPVYKREFYNCNIVSAIAGCSQENGKYTKSFFEIKDEGGTCWDIEKTDDGIQIVMTGGSEVETMVGALRFIADALEDCLHGKAY